MFDLRSIQRICEFAFFVAMLQLQLCIGCVLYQEPEERAEKKGAAYTP